eukprot:CAMPEP_0205923208 /NCGR_PEP_ID=MMETSP1325-20131115/15827_1 /ASSEMBLY_ACC=CAM_ASM_000708 /TAXON_ID=236786 /ORGANISM="Florenciella sp., Strain RCC1007" /LENGTH=53 /DNA_ID=CAMNT_0053291383 /DNA_START=52 /DNA_END=209 /DNA_ORIENTATION=+
MTTKNEDGTRKRHYVNAKLAATGTEKRSGLGARLNIIYDKIMEDKKIKGMTDA